jgi:hypothetical protein
MKSTNYKALHHAVSLSSCYVLSRIPKYYHPLPDIKLLESMGD